LFPLKQWKEILQPPISPYANCHTYGQLVLLGSERCANCGIEIDQEEIFPSALINIFIGRACASANSILSINDQSVLVFLGVTLLRLYVGYPTWFDVATSVPFLLQPTIMIVWLQKYGRWKIPDREYDVARREMRAGLKWWLVAHFLNLVAILASSCRICGA
jgi:hypothetical protein